MPRSRRPMVLMLFALLCLSLLPISLALRRRWRGVRRPSQLPASSGAATPEPTTGDPARHSPASDVDYSHCTLYTKTAPSPGQWAHYNIPAEVLVELQLNLTARLFLRDAGCESRGGWRSDDAAVPLAFEEYCDIMRVDADRLAARPEMFDRYFRGRYPVIFVRQRAPSVLAEAAAFLRNVTRRAILRRYGSTRVATARSALKDDRGGGYNASPNDVGRGNVYTLADYIRRLEQPWRPSTMRVEETDYAAGNPSGSEEPVQALGAFAPNPLAQRFMMNATSQRAIRLLFIGASGSGAAWHKHPSAWATVWFGMKRFFLRPSELALPVPRTPGSRKNTTLQWLHHPGRDGYASMRTSETERRRTSPDRLPLLWDCATVPGETLYVPDNWWHSTLNIGQLISTSRIDQEHQSCGEDEAARGYL